MSQLSDDAFRIVGATHPDGYWPDVVVVSTPAHLDGISDGLLFATEWLVHVAALARGLTSVHMDSLLDPWPAERMGTIDDIYLRGVRWVYDGHTDMTEYRGVSIGQMIGSQTLIIRQHLERLTVAFERLLDAVRPSRVTVLGVAAPFDIVDEAAMSRLLGSMSEACGAVYQDRRDECFVADAVRPQRAVYRHVSVAPDLRETVVECACKLVDWMTRLSADRSRPRVYFFVSTATALNLIETADTVGVTPVFPFRPLPKSARLLRDSFRKGIRLIHVLTGDGDPAGAASTMRARVSAASSDGPLETAFRAALDAHLFESGLSEHLVALVDKTAALIAGEGIVHLVSGDTTSAVGRMLCDLARVHGLQIDETQNGMFVTRMPEPSRSGDGVRPASLTRLLALGRPNLIWNADVNPSVAGERVGYPAVDRSRWRRREKGHRLRILVFPITAWSADCAAMHSENMSLLMRLLRVFDRASVAEVVVKPHPSFDNRTYFQASLRAFGLSCRVVEGNAADWIDWADLAVGPPTSSVFLECLAVGLPYIAVRSTPTSVEPRYVGPATWVDDAETLERTLADRDWMDPDTVFDEEWSSPGGERAETLAWRAIERAVA